jgi:hypothetical protein
MDFPKKKFILENSKVHNDFYFLWAQTFGDLKKQKEG